MSLIIKTDGTVDEVADREFGYKELQAIVGGLIEFVYLANGDLMVVNEEGRYMCPLNPAASKLAGIRIHGDVIVGPQEIGGE